jgi:hypothetical protein
MFFGLSPQVFIHVVISLAAIAVGFVVIGGMLKSQRMPWWTAWFLALTVTTSTTGIVLPATKVLPGHILAALSFLSLGLAIYALYAKKLAGNWRAAYVFGAIISQYFNVFVLIVQSFLKITFLKPLAPTQTEPPFAIAQLVALVAFLVIGVLALKRFRPTA